jgi:hypothetical protein
MKFVLENARADEITIFDFAACGDQCLSRQWMFAIAGHDELVTEVCTYRSGTLYCWLTAVYVDMERLTSNCMLLPIIEASGFRYFF